MPRSFREVTQDPLVSAAVAQLSEATVKQVSADAARVREIGKAHDPFDVLQMIHSLIMIAARSNDTGPKDKAKLTKLADQVDRMVDLWGE